MRAERLTIKQYLQVLRFINKTRSYIYQNDFPIIELLKECIMQCSQHKFDGCDYTKSFIKNIDIVVGKYYPNGYKESRGQMKCSREQIQTLSILRAPRFIFSLFTPKYNPIEKLQFVKAIRACYKYISSKYEEKDKTLFVDTIESIRNMNIRQGVATR